MADEVRYGDGTIRPANATTPKDAELPPLTADAKREEFRAGLGAGQGYSSRGYGQREFDRVEERGDRAVAGQGASTRDARVAGTLSKASSSERHHVRVESPRRRQGRGLIVFGVGLLVFGIAFMAFATLSE